MVNSVVPVRDWGPTSDDGRARGLHGGSDGSFGDTIELVYVGRTSSVAHEFAIEELSELSRKELARVVRVKRADNSDGLSFS